MTPDPSRIDPAGPPPSSGVAERPRLDALSGLRFLAVAYVVVYHLGDASFESMPLRVERFRRHAYLMMPLFFVLSGFVLTYRYADAIRAARLEARLFLLSRLLRIWPIYLVALALRVGIDAYENKGVPIHAALGTLSQALLLQGFTPPLVWWGNAPGWTVSVEAFLYLTFPWIVVRICRMTMSHAVVLALFAWVLGQLAPLAYVVALPDGWPPKGGPSPVFLDALRFLPPLHLPSFLIGIVTARLYLADLAQGRRRAGGFFVLGGFLPIAFALGGGIEFVGHKLGFHPWLFPFGHNGLPSPAWALVVYGLAHGGPSSRWLSARPLVRVGEASYGLYILHFPVYDAVATLAVPEWDHSRLFLVQFFAVMLPLSVLSFEQFEQRLRSTLLARWTLKGARVPRPGS